MNPTARGVPFGRRSPLKQGPSSTPIYSHRQVKVTKMSQSTATGLPPLLTGRKALVVGVAHAGNASRLASVSVIPGFRALADGALTLRAQRDAEIVAQGDRADHCYLVISGCLGTVTLMEDGRRQVGSFLMAGDLFSWELVGDYDAAAEAVTPIVLRRIPISSLEVLAGCCRELCGNWVWRVSDATRYQVRLPSQCIEERAFREASASRRPCAW